MSSLPALPQQPSGSAPRVTPAHLSRQRVGLAGVALLAMSLLYFPTLASMAAVWSRSPTFAHGYAILPVCAWLAWRQRAALALLPVRGHAWGLVWLAGLGLAWLLAQAASVAVVMDYAVLLMLPTTVLTMLGWPMLKALAFPCAYMLLAVPFGEIFIPPLIDFTARFTVTALQWTGVPVYRENNFLSLPSGNWSVADACSGLRYIIASVALGTLYAYLHFRSARRRALFVLAALLVPILANGVRAYAIVMLGHLSNMRLAVGVDHLLYGWIFFGLVCLLLAWCAGFWHELDAAASPGAMAPARRVTLLRPAPPTPLALGAVAGAGACIAVAALWPLLAGLLQAAAPAGTTVAAPLSVAHDGTGWVGSVATPPPWQAGHAGTPLLYAQSFRRADASTVQLQLAWYAQRQAGPGMLDPVAAPPAWLQLDSARQRVALAGRTLTVSSSNWRDGSGRLLVWRWYRQGGVDTDRAWQVKWQLARSRLARQPSDGAEIIVSTRYADDTGAAAAAAVLRDFLGAMLPAIDQGLRHAADATP